MKYEERTNQDNIMDGRVLTAEKLEELRLVIIELFGDSMFHDVGLREICASAGVTTRTVYKHFGTKDSLLIEAIGPDLDRLALKLADITRKKTSFEDRARELVHAYVSFFFDNLSVARIVYLNVPRAYFLSNAELLERRKRTRIEEFHAEGRAAGAFREDASLLEVLHTSAAATDSKIQQSILGDPADLDADAVTEQLWRVFKLLLFKDR